jgi:hypothetical protein
MRIFNGANRMERLRRRAVAAGELIDVTQDARMLGLHETVYLSKRLWKSLIQPYPFAQPDDCLPLSRLLSLLKALLRASQSAQSHAFVVLPSQLPEWFRRPCYLKLFVNAPYRARSSIVVQPFSDPFLISTRRLEDALPATPLVRLAETLRSLMLVARTAEQGFVDSMRNITAQLIHAHPFRLDIDAHMAAVTPETSLPFPPDDYRAMLLADLDEHVAILAKCAGLNSIPKIEALKSHYRALVSPLASFRHILEDLLRFTVSGSDPNAPYQRQVFSLLLSLHSDVNARLKRFETVVPSDSLAVVRFQIRLLAQSIGIPHSQFLADIERTCADLVFDPSAHSLQGPACDRRLAVWH